MSEFEMTESLLISGHKKQELLWLLLKNKTIFLAEKRVFFFPF